MSAQFCLHFDTKDRVQIECKLSANGVATTPKQENSAWKGKRDLVCRVYSHDGGSHQPNSAGHSVAILIQLVKSCISGLDQIHAHAVYHVLERLDVHWKLADCVCKGCVQNVIRPAGKDAF